MSKSRSHVATMIGAYRSYATDLFVFTGVLVAAYYYFLPYPYAPFLLDESSEAFMQFSYYVGTMHSHASPFWDTSINLATAHVPQSPFFSPVTLILLLIVWLFNITAIGKLAALFAAASYAVLILTGFTFYLFLRFLSLGRLASVIGGIGYSYNYFVNFFGIFQGYYRVSALLFFPLVLIYIIKLFGAKERTGYHLAMAGLLIGLFIASNGDIKPAIYFIPLIVMTAYVEGHRVHGALKTTVLLCLVLALGAAVAAPQVYSTIATLGGASRSHFPYVSLRPLAPENTLLGFSQTFFSLIVGFLFPESYFQYYNFNADLGITAIHFWEMRFSFGFSLFLLSIIGLFYRSKYRTVWYATCTMFILYLLGSSTFLWPVFGFLSEHASIRYPTRASIVLYFLFSLYAAYGVEIITGRTVSRLYERWYRPALMTLLAFCVVLAAGMAVAWLRPPVDIDLSYAEVNTLILALSVAFLIVVFLLVTAALFRYEPVIQISGVLVPVAIALFAAVFILFLKSGYLYYEQLISSGDASFATFRSEVAKVINTSLPFYDLQSSKIFGEIAELLLAAGLGAVLLIAGKRAREDHRFRKLVVIVLIAMTGLFLYAGDVHRRVPTVLQERQDAAFQQDPVLTPVYADARHGDYRIQIPRDMRNRLSPDLGFNKSIHNYCCRQYMDDLRLSFGMFFGPQAYEEVQACLVKDYGHPFWKLYNVKYIVDDFSANPWRLPKDSSRYERLSADVIRLKDPEAVAYFRDAYAVDDRESFIREVLPGATDAVLQRAYLHDDPKMPIVEAGRPSESKINIHEFVSGRLVADVVRSTPGILIFSEIWDPFWRATIDGRDVRVLQAYGMLQAVAVPAGRHEVVFVYSPWRSGKMQAALGAGILALVGIAIAVLKGRTGASAVPGGGKNA